MRRYALAALLAVLVGVCAFGQSAGKLDLEVAQGATFSLTLTIQDSTGTAINLTSYTGAAQIRRNYGDSSAVVAFTVTFTDRTNGIVTISLTSTQTAALTANQKCVWDMTLTDGSSTVSRILQGNVTISPRVTR